MANKNQKRNRQTNESEIMGQMKKVDVELKDGVFVYTGAVTIIR